MAATSSYTSSLLERALSTKRRKGLPAVASRHHALSLHQNCTYSCEAASSHRLAGSLQLSRSSFYIGKGWLEYDKLQYGSWNFVSLSKSARVTKASERKDDSLTDEIETLEKRVTSEDAENMKKHINSSVASLDAVVSEATELVVETVEVAAQTVSSVGEIEGPIPIEEPTMDRSKAVKTVVFWVCSAITFGLFIWFDEGSGKASEFFAGYIVEQSLSVDNLFVFVIIFKFFKVPLQYQSRILTYGISGAIVFRATMILLGVATIQKFEVVNLFFASILILTSFKLLTDEEDGDEDLSSNYIVNTCKRFIPVTESYDENKFFTRKEGFLQATPLFLTLAVIELSDIAFAVDSIPAVFGVTRDPFIVFTSNIFAVLGLRSLYTLISSSMGELKYIQPSVAVVLGFIGSKMVADFFGLHVSRELSLGVVVSVLAFGVGLSLWKKEEVDKE